MKYIYYTINVLNHLRILIDWCSPESTWAECITDQQRRPQGGLFKYHKIFFHRVEIKPSLFNIRISLFNSSVYQNIAMCTAAFCTLYISTKNVLQCL